jgi:formate dehydrogenase major subunit
MFRLRLATRPQPFREPFSPQTLAKTSRLRGATVTESVGPYCAVGCGQLISTKAGKVIDIESNPESPIIGKGKEEMKIFAIKKVNLSFHSRRWCL